MMREISSIKVLPFYLLISCPGAPSVTLEGRVKVTILTLRKSSGHSLVNIIVYFCRETMHVR